MSTSPDRPFFRAQCTGPKRDLSPPIPIALAPANTDVTVFTPGITQLNCTRYAQGACGYQGEPCIFLPLLTSVDQSNNEKPKNNRLTLSLAVGKVIYDQMHGVVLSGPYTRGDPVLFTETEKTIFDALAKEPGDVVSYEHITDIFVKEGRIPMDIRTQGVHITNMRTKLKQPRGKDIPMQEQIIATRRSVGFFLPLSQT